MKLFEQFNKYFNFNRRERNGILLLLFFILLLLLTKIFLSNYHPASGIKIQYIATLSDSIQKNDKAPVFSTAKQKNNDESNPGQLKLFRFDPNTISREEALKMGFSNKLTNTLINFRNKGGKFHKKEDLKKLYGLSENHYHQLEKYIVIEQAVKAKKDFPAFTHTANNNFTIELNSADSLDLLNLNGIGPAFSKRIIRFRDALGGFYNKEQLLEVYGMKDSVYLLFEKHLSLDASLVKKLNINKASMEELSKHPYIRQNTARVIVNYRTKHGFYASAEDLKKTGIITQEMIDKLLPYISIE